MNQTRPSWISITSPSRTFAAIGSGNPLPRRPWWHYALDSISEHIEVAFLHLVPWIAGAAAGALTYWLLTR